MSAGNTTSTRTKLALSFFFADLTDQSTMAPIACPLAETHLKAWKIEQSARAPPPDMRDGAMRRAKVRKASKASVIFHGPRLRAGVFFFAGEFN
jgi:hypothetical protein